MMKNDRLFIKIYGYIFMALGLGSLFVTCIASDIENRPLLDSYNYFGMCISFWYFITGIGLLAMRRWGYYLFVFFLYLMLFGFPIGTFIAYKSLKYIKKNKIKAYF